MEGCEEQVWGRDLNAKHALPPDMRSILPHQNRGFRTVTGAFFPPAHLLLMVEEAIRLGNKLKFGIFLPNLSSWKIKRSDLLRPQRKSVFCLQKLLRPAHADICPRKMSEAAPVEAKGFKRTLCKGFCACNGFEQWQDCLHLHVIWG